MKKSSAFSRIVIALLVLSFLRLPVSASGTVEENPSITKGCHSIDAQVPLMGSEPIENAYAAIVYDYSNDTLIYAMNPDERNYPASLVKIMTGLIIAEKANMEDQITVREDVIDLMPSNSLGINLQAGEVISMLDLFYATIVESANDAAIIAADHIYGSQSAFVNEMNRYAEELGCTDTNFVNVTGLHDPDQYTTARDIARILSKAANNEVFMDAFSTVNYTIAATNLSEERRLSSSNYLMNDDMMTNYLDSRVTGGRAGTVETGERNLAATAEKDGIKLVSVVLGSFSVIANNGWQVIEFGSFKETIQLLDMSFQNNQAVQLFYKDQALKQYPVVNGESYVSTGIIEDVKILLPYGMDYENLDYRYNEETTKISAPVKKGDNISSVQIWHDGVCLAHADLYALHDVNVALAGPSDEVIHTETSDANKTLVLVAVILVLFLLLLFGRRILFRILHNRRVRRYRHNRRRSR